MSKNVNTKKCNVKKCKIIAIIYHGNVSELFTINLKIVSTYFCVYVIIYIEYELQINRKIIHICSILKIEYVKKLDMTFHYDTFTKNIVRKVVLGMKKFYYLVKIVCNDEVVFEKVIISNTVLDTYALKNDFELDDDENIVVSKHESLDLSKYDNVEEVD